ncbi:MAG: delta-60 repeat domain-containing protein, partial [Solirubrobacterales bacterium]
MTMPSVFRHILAALLAPVLCVSVSRPARAASPGEVDPTFDAGIVDFGFGSGLVQKVLVQPDGKILMGGAFSTVQGVTRNSLARLHPNGTLDATFVPPFFVAATIPFVSNIVLYPDGRMLVSGSGMNVAGGPVPYSIVRLLPNGSLDPTFTLQGMAVSRGVEG